MKCKKCGYEWKDEGRAKGGRNSKRKITKAQQKKMQDARLAALDGIIEIMCKKRLTNQI